MFIKGINLDRSKIASILSGHKLEDILNKKRSAFQKFTDRLNITHYDKRIKELYDLIWHPEKLEKKNSFEAFEQNVIELRNLCPDEKTKSLFDKNLKCEIIEQQGNEIVHVQFGDKPSKSSNYIIESETGFSRDELDNSLILNKQENNYYIDSNIANNYKVSETLAYDLFELSKQRGVFNHKQQEKLVNASLKILDNGIQEAVEKNNYIEAAHKTKAKSKVYEYERAYDKAATHIAKSITYYLESDLKEFDLLDIERNIERLEQLPYKRLVKPQVRIDLYNLIILRYIKTENYTSALTCYSKIRDEYSKLRDHEKEALTLEKMAEIFRTFKNDESAAEDYLKEAIEIQKSFNSIRAKANMEDILEHGKVKRKRQTINH